MESPCGLGAKAALDSDVKSNRDLNGGLSQVGEVENSAPGCESAPKVDPLPILPKALITYTKWKSIGVMIGANDDPARIAILPAKSCTCCLLSRGQPSVPIHMRAWKTVPEVTLNTALQVFSVHLKRLRLIVWQCNVPHLGQ